MHRRTLGVVAVCGLAAAAGGGIWALRSAERKPVEEPLVLAQAPSPEPAEVAPAVPLRAAPEPVAVPEPAPDPAPEVEQPEPRRWRDPGDVGDEARSQEWERMRAEAFRRLDTDGDGELSEAERNAARAEWEARSSDMRRLMMRRYDRDGDGELSPEERTAAREEGRLVRQEIRDRIVPQYDTDGDGELSESEREAARPAFEAEFQRLRAMSMLDQDGSRTVEPVELAKAIMGMSEQDPAFDINRDGTVDYLDVIYASEIANSN